MEVFGGNGYVDQGPMARLFREMPVNSIWEGSGNVMCLDLLRGISRAPDEMHALLEDLVHISDGDKRLHPHIQALMRDLQQQPEQLESIGRGFAQRLNVQ